MASYGCLVRYAYAGTVPAVSGWHSGRQRHAKCGFFSSGETDIHGVFSGANLRRITCRFGMVECRPDTTGGHRADEGGAAKQNPASKFGGMVATGWLVIA